MTTARTAKYIRWIRQPDPDTRPLRYAVVQFHGDVLRDADYSETFIKAYKTVESAWKLEATNLEYVTVSQVQHGEEWHPVEVCKPRACTYHRYSR